MHRIDTADATLDGHFQDGNPATGQEGTVVDAAILNAVQDEIVNAVLGAGLALDANDNTQLAQAIGTLAGARAGSRNLLANGSFDLWQRDTAASGGTSVAINAAASDKYAADRWVLRSDGTTGGVGQTTASRQLFTPGQLDVPGEPKYFLRWQQTTAATTGRPRLAQRLESVRTAAGGKITASVFLKASAAVQLDLVVVQSFGLSGSPDVEVSRTTIDVDTAWERGFAAVTLPGLEGKTINVGDFLEARLEGPQGATFTVDVADFQVEFGDQLSAYDRRPIELELAYCQRYYEKSWDPETPVGTSTDLGVAAGGENGFDDVNRWRAVAARFRIPKRAVPTVVWYSTTGTANRLSYFDAASPTLLTVTAMLATSTGTTGWPSTAGTTSGLTLHAGGHWTADAEL